MEKFLECIQKQRSNKLRSGWEVKQRAKHTSLSHHHFPQENGYGFRIGLDSAKFS
jgi:hypothetical protein